MAAVSAWSASARGAQILVGCAARGDTFNEDLCVISASGEGIRPILEAPEYDNFGVW